MAKTVVVQYKTHEGANAAENQRLVEQVLDQLNERDPGGVRYAVLRLADGVSFIHVAIFEDDGNALGDTPAFEEFQRAIVDRCVEQPAPSLATLVGSYRFVSP